MMRSTVLMVLFLSAAASSTRGQETVNLQVGQSVEGRLSASERSTFLIHLAANQVVFAEVEQKNLDIAATVYDPEGDRLARIDDASGGLEFIQFESSSEGVYRVELTAGPRQAGRYAIRLDRVEAPARSLEGRVDQWVRFLDRQDRPGGAIALIRSGEVTYTGAFGLANLTHHIPFSTSTPSNIGSVSKPFTAFAIELLEEQGMLSLDDEVHEYLPDLPDFGHTVSLRHLLNHTAGLRELNAVLSLQARVPGRWTREDLIRLVHRQEQLLNPPGQAMRYTNTAYIVLAEVVERVTGESFTRWMERNVFGPLEMEQTTIKAHSHQIIPHSAEGYAGIRGEQLEWEEGDELDAFFGATGVYSTVQDLAKWVEHLGQPRVGGQNPVSRMTQRSILTSGDTLDFGLGLFIDTHDGLRRFYHAGEDGGHFAAFYYFPEIDAGVAYLSNSRGYFATLGRIAEGLFREEQVARGVPALPSAELGEDALVEIDEALLDAYTGHYGAEGPGLIIVVSREDNHLSMEVSPWWTEPYRLTFQPVSDSTFVEDISSQRVTFRRDLNGNVDRVTWQGGMVYRRMMPLGPSEEDLEAFAGQYYSEELEVMYRLRVEDGGLRLTDPRLRDSEVRPWEPDVFRTVFPLVELRFSRGDDGEVSGFEVASGLWFRKVR